MYKLDPVWGHILRAKLECPECKTKLELGMHYLVDELVLVLAPPPKPWYFTRGQK